MLTRAAKRTLLLKLNDPQVYSFITTMEDHLYRHIEVLENEIREADEEVEEMESYVVYLRETLNTVKNFGAFNGIVAVLTLGYAAYSCSC
jgi:SPX domain protein involved in polyphosphate accumulation